MSNNIQVPQEELERAMQVPYTVMLRRDEDGDVIAEVKELEGCAAHGSTYEEAIQNIEAVKKLWLTSCIRQGCSLPKAEAEIEALPSGKWLQRVPRSIHKGLSDLARKEGVSLNLLVSNILSEAVGRAASRQEHNFTKQEQQFGGFLLNTKHTSFSA